MNELITEDFSNDPVITILEHEIKTAKKELKDAKNIVRFILGIGTVTLLYLLARYIYLF